MEHLFALQLQCVSVNWQKYGKITKRADYPKHFPLENTWYQKWYKQKHATK